MSKTKKPTSETKRIADLLPIQRYDSELSCYCLRDNTYMDMMQISSKDLINVSQEEVKLDCLALIKLYRTYGDDIKVVGMNFPTDTSTQRRYIDKVQTRTNNFIYKRELEIEQEKLETIQKNLTEREYYVFIYGKNRDEIIENRNSMIGTLSRRRLIQTLTYDKKQKILTKINNPISRIELDDTSTQESYNMDEIKKIGFDPSVIENIQPRGGISFRDDEVIKTGDGMESCLTVYDFPTDLNYHWLGKLMNNRGIISVVDIATQGDMYEVKKNINKSIREQSSRYSTAKDETDKEDAKEEYWRLKENYKAISQLNEIIKNIRVHLFVSDATLHGLAENTANIKNELDTAGYKCAINMNEGKYDWLSKYLSYKKQDLFPTRREGQPFFSGTLAYGNPFHFSSLLDERGFYMGESDSTKGIVAPDWFHNDDKRGSYNGVIVGKIRSGKSTTLKKMFKDRAIRGDYIRGFDVSGEWRELVKEFGGKIISLDGNGGVLNPLEILKTNESELQSYSQHLSKIKTMYKFWVPDADSKELAEFESLLGMLYRRIGIINEKGNPTEENGNHVAGLPPTTYPILSDLLEMMDEILSTDYTELDPVQQKIKIEELKRIADIRVTINNLISNYGMMFNGHTTMENILETQIVFFDIVGLVKYAENIVDSQMFSALSLCYDNCVKIGTLMKNGYEEWKTDHTKGIDWDSITRFMILVDEAHRFINANKLTALDQLVTYEREARKFFGGIWFASQSIRDFVPEGANSDGISMIKKLFELAQYKIIMQQDNNAVEQLVKIFEGDASRSELEVVPTFEMGQCILIISGVRNIRYHNYITKEEDAMFKGGA